MATEVTTRILAEGEYPHWATLVAGSPDGSGYSLPDYLDALCGAAGGSYRVLVAEREGQIVGGIALYECPSRFGTCISPRLLLYYNGIVLMPHDTKYPSQRASWHLQTLAALEQALSRMRHARLRLKSRATFTDCRVFQSHGWSIEPHFTYVVDISDLDAAWSRVDKNLRRLVGRCREQGLEMTMDGDFDAFYRLHVQTHERKGAALYLPREAFRIFIEDLRSKDLCRLYHARLPDGRAIATQLVQVSPHPVTHTLSAGADAEFLNLGASAFLRWKVFEDLARRGYKANDMTDAALNPVTHFKSQLGGDLMMCLEISRPDHPVLRLGERAISIPRRAKRRLLRMLRPAAERDA
ncbi:GNAT family N-acetyltransferase [Dokdonella soli]|uniref:BioF2-like acetyltransferase domain-containing protein n=1 Tax=Dokdonella soli TaxID=529810 RepID=A0ABN1INS9_9GAMM